MISVILHAEDEVVGGPLPLSRISDALAKPDALLWVDVIHPTPEELHLLQEEFSLHPLALEDVANERQRPKLEFYDDVAFLVFYRLGRDAEREVQADQIGIFYGKNFVVTVHRDALPELGELCQRWLVNRTHITGSLSGLLLYSVLDLIVDEYLPLLDEILEDIDEIEDRIFVDFDATVQQQVFQLKKDLLKIRRVVSPERDVVNQLMRVGDGVEGSTTNRYLADVYDHLVRVTDSVDVYRDLLASALDSYLSVTSNQLNQVMRRLTASSIILMGMTLVAGIYGMNFIHMPELRWQLGYPMALGLMAVIGVALTVVFKRIDWL